MDDIAYAPQFYDQDSHRFNPKTKQADFLKGPILQGQPKAEGS